VVILYSLIGVCIVSGMFMTILALIKSQNISNLSESLTLPDLQKPLFASYDWGKMPFPQSAPHRAVKHRTKKRYSSIIPDYHILSRQHDAEFLAHKSVVNWQLGKAVEILQFGVTITDLKGTILYVNPAEARMHGYTEDELLGKDLGILAPLELRNPMTVQQILHRNHLRESINRRKDGSTFPVRLRTSVVQDPKGEPIAIVTLCEDITEQKKTAEKLRQHTRELTLLNCLNDTLQECEKEEDTYGIMMKSCQKIFPEDSGCLCIMNPQDKMMQVVDFWGSPPDDAPVSSSAAASAGHPEPEKNRQFLCPHRLYNPHHECTSIPIVVSEDILGLLSLCFKQPPSGQAEERYQQGTKSKQAILTRITRHYALALTNLRLREQLRIEAMHDPLTGLYNRRYMEDSLKREAYRAKRHNGHIGIIMLDIDHFKQFNDLYGHDTGDKVLQELGEFLSDNVRGEDIACRYGGEEFLIILPNATLEASRARAEELRNGIKNLHFTHEKQDFQITISAGVADLPTHGRAITDVVRQSDRALYRAKALGRDQVVLAS